MKETELPRFTQPWFFDYKELRKERLAEITDELDVLLDSPSVDGRYIKRLLHERRTNAEGLLNTEHNKRIYLFANILRP
jgi:hypothetical protein